MKGVTPLQQIQDWIYRGVAETRRLIFYIHCSQVSDVEDMLVKSGKTWQIDPVEDEIAGSDDYRRVMMNVVQ